MHCASAFERQLVGAGQSRCSIHNARQGRSGEGQARGRTYQGKCSAVEDKSGDVQVRGGRSGKVKVRGGAGEGRGRSGEGQGRGGTYQVR